jgi:hypothetical protein
MVKKNAGRKAEYKERMEEGFFVMVSLASVSLSPIVFGLLLNRKSKSV